MARAIPATLQTVYAELMDRCSIGHMIREFPLSGSFYKRRIRDQEYWYYKPSVKTDPLRREKYVGQDTDAIREMIENHGMAKAELRERRSLVLALQGAGLRPQDPMTGKILSALSEAGLFRLRAVVIGSVAYQAYGGLLGRILDPKNLATNDLDIAQFSSISIGIEDSIDMPFLDILQEVDKSFRPVPGLYGTRPTQYIMGNGSYRLDILTPNRGADNDEPVSLPAIRTNAQPLRYLDFLIYKEIKAVVLYGNGVLINTPSPERYAIHKLLVSRMRLQSRESQAKAGKDLRQAGELLEILLEDRPFEVRDVWEEAISRGPKWRQYLTEAVSMLDRAAGSASTGEALLRLVDGEDGSGGSMSGGPS